MQFKYSPASYKTALRFEGWAASLGSTSSAYGDDPKSEPPNDANKEHRISESTDSDLHAGIVSIPECIA